MGTKLQMLLEAAWSWVRRGLGRADRRPGTAPSGVRPARRSRDAGQVASRPRSAAVQIRARRPRAG